MQILIGGVIGAIVGVAAWWAARYFIAGYQAQSTAPVHATEDLDSSAAPAGVPATNPLTPAGGGEGVLSPGGDLVDPATTWPENRQQLPTRFWTPQALAVCLALTAWGAYVGWRAPAPPVAVGALLVTAVLLTISLVDLRVRRIPNLLVLLLLAWAVVQSLWLGQPTMANLAIGLLAAGGFFFLLALLTRGAMGLGDVKLAAATGALVGWPAMVAALLLGILAGGVAALLLLLTRRAGRKDYFAYGPYLASGAWVVYCAFLGLWG
jgi:Flp pilus assembly protein protease CpaA